MTKKNLPQVQIFSDGGANPNPGPGGYGVILKCGEHQKDFSQGYTMTTNNRMELMGAITGLQKLKVKSRVVLTTDSQYTINGIQKGWAKKWKANNWMRTGSQKAQNWDLWKIFLEELEKHEVSFDWVRGHTGHIENELCDELATLAMQRDDLIVDKGYIPAPEKPKQTPLSNLSGSSLNSPQAPHTIFSGEEKGGYISKFELTGTSCKKCQNPLVKKYPKHSKKTLEKQYYYEYYHHCESCKTNYMLQEAKREISTLKL